jgi:hypothetical protein
MLAEMTRSQVSRVDHGTLPRLMVPWVERMAGVVAAAGLLLVFVAALALILRFSFRAGSASTATYVLHATLLVLSGYLTFQCGRAFVRLQIAPIYPRENYYGRADIAPEEPGRLHDERGWLFVAGLLLLAPDFGLVYAMPAVDQIAPSAGLVAGILAEALRAWWIVKPGPGATLESKLQGQYILYLRNFRGSRASIAIATLNAARPLRMVLIVSPQRVEARSVLWYLVAMLRPLVFDYIHLWSTTDVEWYRVVASCMAHSRGIVIDCAGVSQNLSDQGLMLEMAISLGFADEHPTAYAISPDQSLPMPLPLPAVLKVGSGLIWHLRYRRRLVERLRAVLTRALTEDESRYLAAYYSWHRRQYQEAMIRDRNLASREDREDPHNLLLKRRERTGPDPGL